MFWIGFVAFGSMAMVSFIWGTVFCPTTTGIMINGKKHYPPMSPPSAMWTAWGYYYQIAFWILKPLPYSDQILGVGGEMPVVTIVVVCYLPQLLIAAVGGLLARSVIRRWEQGSWW